MPQPGVAASHHSGSSFLASEVSCLLSPPPEMTQAPPFLLLSPAIWQLKNWRFGERKTFDKGPTPATSSSGTLGLNPGLGQVRLQL